MSNIKDEKKETKERLKKVLSRNIRELREALEWNNKQFSLYLGVSEATMSNISNGNTLPDLDLLAVLCNLQEIKDQGFDFTLQDILSDDFNPKAAKEKREKYQEGLTGDELISSFIGNYFCYFFDQSKPMNELDVKQDRNLRYGVISIHNTTDGINGKQKNHVFAKFFKDDDYKNAVKVKEDLDERFSKNAKNMNNIHKSVQEYFKSDDDVYYGELLFHGDRAFIAIESAEFFDQALIILYTSSKKAKKHYCGGLGTVSSVTHGNDRMPTAQKIILSEHILNNATQETIAQHLSVSSVVIKPTTESVALGNLCKQLYNSNDELVSLMSDNDKISIITNRVSQLVYNYINKNICCVASVSKDEDKKVYDLIQQSVAMEYQEY